MPTRKQCTLIATFVFLLIPGHQLMAQTRPMASLSDAEMTASILQRLHLRATSGSPTRPYIDIPDVSRQALDLIITELNEAAHARTSLPRYEMDALCEVWNNSSSTGDARVIAALEAYDAAALEANTIYARPFFEAEVEIQRQLTGEDLDSFNSFVNSWKDRYRSGSGQTGSFFSTVIRNNPALGPQSFELHCSP